jgi:hypothetical protein
VDGQCRQARLTPQGARGGAASRRSGAGRSRLPVDGPAGSGPMVVVSRHREAVPAVQVVVCCRWGHEHRQADDRRDSYRETVHLSRWWVFILPSPIGPKNDPGSLRSAGRRGDQSDGRGTTVDPVYPSPQDEGITERNSLRQPVAAGSAEPALGASKISRGVVKLTARFGEEFCEIPFICMENHCFSQDSFTMARFWHGICEWFLVTC